MPQKTKLILLGSILGVCVLVLLVIKLLSNRPESVTTEDVKNMEIIQSAAPDDAAKSPPPMQFPEPAVKPPTGRKEPLE